MDRYSEHGDGPPVPTPIPTPTPTPSLGSAPAADQSAETDGAERAADGAPPEAMPATPSAGGPRNDDDATSAPDAAQSSDLDPADTLSPAVRRLVRQYDLDITGVYGSGPAGKIRVGDIIGMLDGRADPRARTSEGASRAQAGAADAGAPPLMSSPAHDSRNDRVETRPRPPEDSASSAGAVGSAMTTVFECDVSRVLSHRKRERQGEAETLLASYFVAGCIEALSIVPELAAGTADSTQNRSPGFAPRLGVSLATVDGSLRRALVDAAAPSSEERMRAVDVQLRRSVDEDLRPANIVIHYYAASGSLLATPTPIGAGQVGSIGIGRVRREIVVKTVDGQEAPRVAALCYLTLTFRPEHIPLERANRFVGEWVRVLEQWPIEPTSVA